MRIVYLGSGDFGLPTLKALADRHEVALVVSQPDRPAGRDRKPTPTPIAQWVLAQPPLARQLIRTPDVNEAGVLTQIKALKPDAIVVIAFGQKLGQELIHLPRLKAVNLHASLLPAYRGAAPIQRAMMNGERVTGLCVITLAERIDAGDILGTASTPIDPLENAGELARRMAAMGPEVVLRVLEELEAGTSKGIAQDHARASRAGKLSKEESAMDFTLEPRLFAARVHGLTPWPGACCWWSADGGQRQQLWLRRVRVVEHGPRLKPGEVTNLGICGVGDGGAVELLEVQAPGRNAMAWGDFIRGARLNFGCRFYSEEKTA